MKVAFIIGKFPALSETFVLNQITGLIDRGHTVEIFADKSDEGELYHPEIDGYSLLENTHYFSEMPIGWFSRVFKTFYLILLYFPKNPYAIFKSFDIKNYGWMATSLRLLYLLMPFIGENRKYDIIHCHFGINGMRAMYLKDVGLISGYVTTVFHGKDVTVALKKYGPNLYDHLLKNGDLFLPISEKWKQEIIKLGADNNRTVVHRMGVGCKKNLRPKKSNNQNIQLVSVCRLTEKKGIEYAIKALAFLKLENVNFCYDIVGDGPLLMELSMLSKKLGINDKISFHGAMNKADVSKLLSQADIFVLPSITAADGDQEGIPVSIMEAMAIGLPVISTWHSGIPELIDDGTTGLLVKEHDVNELKDAMKRLISDESFRVKLGLEAHQFVMQNYNIDRLNCQLESLYSHLLKGNNAWLQ